MAQYIEVKPAYGADYTSQKAVKEAWDQGSDFRDYQTGRFLNKADAEQFLDADTHILVRYADERKVFQVN